MLIAAVVSQVYSILWDPGCLDATEFNLGLSLNNLWHIDDASLEFIQSQYEIRLARIYARAFDY